MVKGFIALTLDMDFYTLFVFYLIPKQGNNDADIIFKLKNLTFNPPFFLFVKERNEQK